MVSRYAPFSERNKGTIPLLWIEWQLFAISIRSQRPPHLIEQFSRSVPVAPGVHVVPVDPIALHGNHATGILKMLRLLADLEPAKFRDNCILDRRQEHVAVEKTGLPTAGKTLHIV